VIGIDIYDGLVKQSIENMKHGNPELLEKGIVKLKVGDGWKGDPEEGPFDAIHVGAGAEALPQSLLDQIKPGKDIFRYFGFFCRWPIGDSCWTRRRSSNIGKHR
jgi:protein-L-isoaspartate O-methyltransferase